MTTRKKYGIQFDQPSTLVAIQQKPANDTHKLERAFDCAYAFVEQLSDSQVHSLASRISPGIDSRKMVYKAIIEAGQAYDGRPLPAHLNDAIGAIPWASIKEDNQLAVPYGSVPVRRLDVSHLSQVEQLVGRVKGVLEFEDLFGVIEKGLGSLIPFDTFAVFLVDRHGSHLRLIHMVGYQERVDRWVFGEGQGIVGHAFQDRAVVRVPDVKMDSRYINSGEGISSEMAVALNTDRGTIGVLDIGSNRINFFTQQDEILMRLLSDPIANALESCLRHEERRNRAQARAWADRIARKIEPCANAEEFVDVLAMKLKQRLDFSSFHVLRWSERLQRLISSFAVPACLDPRTRSPVSLDCGVAGTAGSKRRPIRISNVATDSRFIPEMHPRGVRSVLALPLVLGEALVGVLVLESTTCNAFSEGHKECLENLAPSIANRIAKTFTKTEEDEETLDKQPLLFASS